MGKEQVVGWFSVGESAQLDDSTLAIHQFYRTKESKFAPQMTFKDPVYLQVDTAIRDCATPIDIKAFTTGFIPGTDESLIQFYELPILSTNTASKTGDNDIEEGGQEAQIVAMLSEACQRQHKDTNGKREGAKISSLDSFGKQLGELRDLFQLARQYIADVQSGAKRANPEVGRALMRALEGDLPDEGSLKSLVKAASQDALMVQYLSTLCKTQIVLTEKIQRIMANTQQQDS